MNSSTSIKSNELSEFFHKSAYLIFKVTNNLQLNVEQLSLNMGHQPFYNLKSQICIQIQQILTCADYITSFSFNNQGTVPTKNIEKVIYQLNKTYFGMKNQDDSIVKKEKIPLLNQTEKNITVLESICNHELMLEKLNNTIVELKNNEMYLLRRIETLKNNSENNVEDTLEKKKLNLINICNQKKLELQELEKKIVFAKKMSELFHHQKQSNSEKSPSDDNLSEARSSISFNN